MFQQISVEKSFNLLDNYFPKPHKLCKLFNRNNSQVRYSSLPNFISVINSYNEDILHEQEKPPYSCRDKTSCPLNGNC